MVSILSELYVITLDSLWIILIHVVLVSPLLGPSVDKAEHLRFTVGDVSLKTARVDRTRPHGDVCSEEI